jgi:hypothetical protein
MDATNDVNFIPFTPFTLDALHLQDAQFLKKVFEITTADTIAAVGEIAAGRLAASPLSRVTHEKQTGEQIAHKLYKQYIAHYLSLCAKWLQALNADDYSHLYVIAIIEMRKAEERDGGLPYTGQKSVYGLTRTLDAADDADLLQVQTVTPADFGHQSLEISSAALLAHLMPVLVDRIRRYIPGTDPYANKSAPLNQLGLDVLHAYGEWMATTLSEDSEHFVSWVIGKSGEISFLRGVVDESGKIAKMMGDTTLDTTV